MDGSPLFYYIPRRVEPLYVLEPRLGKPMPGFFHLMLKFVLRICQVTIQCTHMISSPNPLLGHEGPQNPG
jgi:hypothetical protein